MPITANQFNTPVLRGVIGAWRQTFGLMRDSMKKVEGAFIDPSTNVSSVPLWSMFGEPILRAERASRVWMADKTRALDAIGKRFKTGDGEDILAGILSDDPGNFGFRLPARNKKVAQDMEKWMLGTLEDAGLTPKLAKTFLKQDMPQLRNMKGDFNRMSPMDLYPVSFQPFFRDMQNGMLGAGQNNAYSFAHDLMNLSARAQFMNPTARTANKALNQMTLGNKKLAGSDRDAVRHLARTMLRDVTEFQPKAQEQATVFINDFFKKMKGYGLPEMELDPNTTQRWARNMTSWYGGVAMAGRPALVARNMTQVLLPGLKVGFGEIPRALKQVYGSGRKDIISKALKDLGIPEGGENLAFFGQEGAQVSGRIVNLLKDMQKQGLRPYRWADRVNNRVTTYQMGLNSVNKHGAEFQSGKIDWDTFLMRTGLQGSHKVDQLKIKQLIGKGKDVGNLEKAAREYGKTLVEDTQFIYNGSNAPSVFRGNVGRLFGQFGTWPIAFTEFAWQNTMGGGGTDWATLFARRYFTQKVALGALGTGLGIDTSSWNYANPLTFQGGPWFQAIRDVSVLGTSANEFDKRKARGTVRRMLGSTGTPFVTSAFNPLGGLATDFLQAQAETSPLDATLLGLGFNLQSAKPATRR